MVICVYGSQYLRAKIRSSCTVSVNFERENQVLEAKVEEELGTW